MHSAPTKTRFSLLRLLLPVVMALATLGSASTASALEQVTLQLKWLHQFQFAGYYAAVQQGYYREAGLDVTIKPATPGKDPVQEVVTGKAEYGVGTSSLLLLRNAGKPVVTLAVIFQHSPFILLTKERSANQTIHSLTGKRLMLEPLSEELTAYLLKEGLPLEKMQMLEHSFNLKDLIAGKVDAISGYITTDPNDLDRARFAYHAYTPRSAGIDFYGDNLFTSESELKNHPDRARAFREASLKGWHYALDHPDEIIELILSRYTPPGFRADRAHLKYEADEIRKLIQPNLVEIGYMHSGRWRHIADTYNELGMLPKNIDLKKFMYDPHPQRNLTQIYWIASSMLGLALLIIAVRLIKTSRNLKKSEKLVREQYNEIRQMNESLEEQVASRTKDLLEAKLFSEQIIISAQDGVVVYDRDLRYRVWNPYMERLTDLTAAEVLGCHPLKFFPFMQEHGMIERLEKMLIDGIPVASDVPFFIPGTKSSGWASDMSAPLRDAQGEIIGIIATVRDITEKRLTRMELLDKQKLLEETNFELEVQFEESLALQEELAETLKQLQNSEESHSAIIQSAMDGFWLVDAQGRLLEVNKSYCRMSGYSEQELLAMTIADLEYIESTVDIAARIEKMMTLGEYFFETQHRRKDCSTFYLEVSIQYLPIDGGRFAVFLRDITERKQAEGDLLDKQNQLENMNYYLETLFREEQLLRTDQTELLERLRNSETSKTAIIQMAMDGFWLVDAQGRLLEVNNSYCRMSGYSEQELLSMNISDLEYLESTVDGAARIEKMMTLGEYFFETRHRRKDGSTFYLEASIQCIPIDGGRFVLFMRDITERKQMEEELLSSKSAAEQANISKSQFLSNMSHEIRTPLNAIIGFSSLMLRSTLSSVEHDFVRKINTAGETLLNVINDILDFSKIEAGQLNLEQIPFMLEPLLATSISMVQLKAMEKDLPLLINTVPGIAPCLIGDPLRLGQVIVNLLNNAVKFTEHGVVTIEAALLKEENGRQQLAVSIHDTGIGIPSEQIATLFQPFTQVDESTTRRFGGTGLGLSICKQIVELMEGEIYCQSTPGLGSVFSFTAWFGIGQCDSTVPTALTTAATYDFSTHHVLLVEDHEVNQQLARELLKDTGVALTVASNGAEAVNLVINGSTVFDLVLMDIQMPVMDGYEATWLIRADSRFATLPIIAMTAHAMLEEQQKILKSGMDAHISKPIDVYTLLRIMHLFMGEPTGEMPLPEAPAKSDGGTAEILVIAGLDVTGALERLDGNEKLYRWLLRSFVENKTDSVKIIDEALQSGNIELALRTVHTVKSSAGTIGALELESRAERLENVIELGESAKIVSVALRDFTVEMELVVAILAKTLPPAEPDNNYSLLHLADS